MLDLSDVMDIVRFDLEDQGYEFVCSGDEHLVVRDEDDEEYTITIHVTKG